MRTPRTLVEYLQLRAREKPGDLYARYLFPEKAPVELTYRQTERRTRQFAEAYAQRGVRKEDVVLLILPYHEDTMPAFMGAMWLAAIPALLSSLTSKLDPHRYYQDLKGQLEHTRPRIIVTHRELHDVLDKLLPRSDERPTLMMLEDASSVPEHGDPSPHEPDDVAFIQYSSGSTGLQKGVQLTHRASLVEMEGVCEFFELTDEDGFFTWVPLYHDWGMVVVALQSMQLGAHCTLLSPIHWVTRPVVAFEAIHQYRPTVFNQPNFAFNFMTMRITDEEMEGLDLSSLRICCNGAEPCLYESHEMFLNRFQNWGLNPESISIIYGMAEFVCIVSAAGPREPIQVDRIDRQILQAEHRAQPVDESHPNAIRVLGVGRPLKQTRFRILDDDRRELPERHIGEIEIQSPAHFKGYYRNPEATAARDNDGGYLTGDLGYRVGDIFYLAGRKSDVIIIGGVNIYPHDVENIVAEHPAVVAGRVAAVGVDDPDAGTQKLVVIAESRSTDPNVLEEIAMHSRREVPLRLLVDVDKVYHAPHKWLIKTSSGKMARIPNYERLGGLDCPVG